MRTAIRKSMRHLVQGLGGMMAAGLAVSVIVWMNIDRVDTAERLEQEARVELGAIAAVMESMDDRETGLRGYLLTHDSAYLGPYAQDSRRFEDSMSRLRDATRDDPSAMRERVEDIQRQADLWTRETAEPAVAAARSGHPLLNEASAGRARMDAIRADIAFLRGEGARLVETRDEMGRQAIWASRVSLVAGSLIAGLIAIVVGGRSFWGVIAARRAAEAWAARLENALERAHAAERAKTDFLANMSHEMRTPLNGVMGMADALASTRLTVRQRSLLEEIRISATTLDALIANLLHVSRGGEAAAPATAFRLADAVRDMVGEHRDQARLKGLSLEVAICAEADQEVVGDLAALRQLIGCLLSNAVKFTTKGTVRVTVLRCEAAWRFEVADTGEGFDDARKGELFEAFGQSDVSATRNHGGAGVGLALAARLAAELGGRLDCQSTPGEGSLFSVEVELPVAGGVAREPEPATAAVGADASHAPGAEPAEATPADADDAPLRMLIVDDNATNRRVLEVILEQLGVEWVSVQDGAQAVEAAARQDFAAILMDIQMPVMDGLAATREIRRQEQARHGRQTPVVIVSANGQPEHVQAGRAAGAQAHLTKPVSAELLLSTLNAVLEPEAQGAQAA